MAEADTYRFHRLPLAVLIVVALAVPLVSFHFSVGRAPTASPHHAQNALADRTKPALLVDVRPTEDAEKRRVEGAYHWPYASLAQLSPGDPLPAEVQGKRLFLLCESGILSGLAANRLVDQHDMDALNIEGGISAWIASSARHPEDPPLRMATEKAGDIQSVEMSEGPFIEQLSAVITGFVVKPAYMVLTLVLIILLRKRDAADMIALRWGLALFLIGESFCAINYLFFDESSELVEYLHSFGMVLCFGFVTWAVLEGMDHRVLKVSDQTGKCAPLGRLCEQCIKNAPVPCGFQRVFLVAIPALVVMALLPMMAELHVVSYNETIFGTPYNYSHAVVQQVFELRYCPLLAMLLLVVSFLALAFKKNHPVAIAKYYFAAAMGPLCFSFLRLVIFAPFRDKLVWFAFWEEVTELIFVVGVACVLWIFRGRLFAVPRGSAST